MALSSWVNLVPDLTWGFTIQVIGLDLERGIRRTDGDLHVGFSVSVRFVRPRSQFKRTFSSFSLRPLAHSRQD